MDQVVAELFTSKRRLNRRDICVYFDQSRSFVFEEFIKGLLNIQVAEKLIHCCNLVLRAYFSMNKELMSEICS